MTFFTDYKLYKALRDYDLSENADDSPVTFSESFELKMNKLLRSHRRINTLASVARSVTATAACAVVLALGGRLVLSSLPSASHPASNTDPMTETTEMTEETETLAIQADAAYEAEVEPAIAEDSLASTDTISEETRVMAADLTPPAPTGKLVLTNDEPRMGIDANLRQGIQTWEEAQKAASFVLAAPDILPDGAWLHFIELSQHGDNSSYPCVASLYKIPMSKNGGVWHLYLYQYYIGPEGDVVLNDPAETVSVGDFEALFYTFTKIGSTDDLATVYPISMLQWTQGDVLFRLCGAVDGFTLDDLLSVAASVR